jgi:hypothetical protein
LRTSLHTDCVSRWQVCPVSCLCLKVLACHPKICRETILSLIRPLLVSAALSLFVIEGTNANVVYWLLELLYADPCAGTVATTSRTLLDELFTPRLFFLSIIVMVACCHDPSSFSLPQVSRDGSTSCFAAWLYRHRAISRVPVLNLLYALCLPFSTNVRPSWPEQSF